MGDNEVLGPICPYKLLVEIVYNVALLGKIYMYAGEISTDVLSLNSSMIWVIP